MIRFPLITGSLLLLASCTTSAPMNDAAGVPQPPANAPMETGQLPAENFMMIHVMNWAFMPDTVTFRQGENASLHVMVMEGNHGITIPGLGISEDLPEGANVIIPIPTDTPGTYEFRCNVYCGEGHPDMKGTIIIE